MKNRLECVSSFIIILLLLGFTTKAQETDDTIVWTEEDLAQFYAPLVFDSIKTTDFLDFFPYQRLTVQPINEIKFSATEFEKMAENNRIQEKLRRQSLYRISLEHPEVIKYCALKPYDFSIGHVEMEDMIMRIEGLKPSTAFVNKTDFKKLMSKKEKSPWSFDGSLAVQFSQYYVTDNWYKGGTPNATFLTIFDYNIDYTKDRFVWENDFDVKIGFYNTSEDTIRAFRVNNDVVQVATLLAYQTWFSKKVFYSAAVDFETSLFTGYKKTNSNEVVSAFLSPSRIFFSVGMECRYNKKTLIRLAPLTDKLIFKTDDRIDPLHVGLDSTQNYKNYLGYLVQAKIDWKFSKEINLTSNIDFFCSYDSQNIEFDWEVVGKFVINRYLSTRLSLIMRYDNTPLDEEAKIQIQEQLSFGFNYVFR